MQYNKRAPTSRENLFEVGAITYYEKTTQCKDKLLIIIITGLLGSGMPLHREGRFDLESGNMEQIKEDMRKSTKKTYTFQGVGAINIL